MYDPAVYEAYGYAGGEAQLPGEHAAPDGCLLLALVDAKLAGCIALRKFSEGECEMRMLFVQPEFHGQGIDKTLVLRLLDEAKKLGYSSMRLETSTGMDSAHRLYRSLGFRDVQAYYAVEHSLKDVEMYMEKALG